MLLGVGVYFFLRSVYKTLGVVAFLVGCGARPSCASATWPLVQNGRGNKAVSFAKYPGNQNMLGLLDFISSEETKFAGGFKPNRR